MSGKAPPPWAGWAFITVATKSHLSFARALCKDLLAHHPGARMIVLLADRADGFFEPAAEEFEVVFLETLGVEGLPDLAFKYGAGELCMALKSFFLEHVLGREGIDRAVYLDVDILVLRAFHEIRTALETCEIVLTPHVLSPVEPDGHRPDEMDFLRTGTFNGGMLALKKGLASGRFLRWWKERVRDGCFVDFSRGLFVDQKWIDLAPSLFGACLLRHRGYNVAYWNIPERLDLRRAGEGYSIGDEPLVFLHLSGADPERRDLVSKHQTRLTLGGLDEGYRSLFELYWRQVDACGLRETWRWPYAFGAFSNGVRIPGLVRKLYRSLGDRRFEHADPFDASGPGSFFSGLFESPEGDGPLPSALPLLVAFLYESRPDLWKAFPDPHRRDALALMNWVLEQGEAGLDLDESYLVRLRAIRDRLAGRDQEARRLEAERLREAEDGLRRESEKVRRETEEKVRAEVAEKVRLETEAWLLRQAEEKARLDTEERLREAEELREHRERFEGAPKSGWKRGVVKVVGMDRYLRARLAYWSIRGLFGR